MKLSSIQTALGFTLLWVFLSLSILMLYPKIGNANPSDFVRSLGTSSSTSSPQYMTAGTATTTENFSTTAGTVHSMDSAVLQLAIKSSTTISTSFGTTTLSIRIESSDNCVDWTVATTSTLQPSITETVGGGGLILSTTSVAMRTIPVPTPILKCERAIVGVQPGSSNNAAVWMQFIGRRENN